jgi:hypothetical protein
VRARSARNRNINKKVRMGRKNSSARRQRWAINRKNGHELRACDDLDARKVFLKHNPDWVEISSRDARVKRYQRRMRQRAEQQASLASGIDAMRRTLEPPPLDAGPQPEPAPEPLTEFVAEAREAVAATLGADPLAARWNRLIGDLIDLAAETTERLAKLGTAAQEIEAGAQELEALARRLRQRGTQPPLDRAGGNG